MNFPVDAQLLNSRQRKHVYMHSTIFDSEGPSTRSVYAPARQQALYNELSKNMIKPDWSQADLKLPSPADIRCTQNHGSEAVLPSKAGYPGPPQYLPTSAAPRASSTTCLVEDGEAISVIKAEADDGAIPKEYWATSVNLQWNDPRNELNRKKDQAFQDRLRMNAA